MQEQKTKVKIVSPDKGLTRRLMNCLIIFKATAADTNGLYSLFEIYAPPGEGMLPHLQRYEDEAFWVLQGTFSFLFAEQELVLGAGGYAFVPRGTLHGFSNSGRSTARMLSLVTPGGIHERFFAEVDKSAADSPTALSQFEPADLPRIIRIAEKYGIEILLPAGA